ncbi:hypothetical protein ACFLX8_00045 [Chloroflexota bacterium]
MKIILPVSFLVVLIQWFGLIYHLDFVFRPLMKLINLPPEAFLPILAGIFADVYGSIAVMVSLPFSREQMTLIAIFSTISHALVIEGAIQARSGINVFKITLLRLIAASLAVLMVSWLFEGTEESIGTLEIAASVPLIELLTTWGLDTLALLGQIFAVIMLAMIIQEVLISLGLIKYLFNYFQPIINLMGLPHRMTFAWLAAILAGVTFGAAIIIEECKKGIVSKEEMEYLQISIGINHSMIEQIAIYGTLGLNVAFIVLPRLLTAIIAVWFIRGWRKLKPTLGFHNKDNL